MMAGRFALTVFTRGEALTGAPTAHPRPAIPRPQECKTLNGRLIQRLRSKESVEGLVRLALGLGGAEEPGAAAAADAADGEGGAEGEEEGAEAAEGEAAAAAEAAEADEDTGTQDLSEERLPFASCEILCCDVDAINATLLEEEELLKLFMGFVSQEGPLDALGAGYFGRILGTLLNHRLVDRLLGLLQTHEEYLVALVRHAGTTSVAAVLSQLVGESTAYGAATFSSDWLTDTNLLELLFGALEAQEDPAVRRNVASILACVAQKNPTLGPVLGSEACLRRLLALFEKGEDSSIIAVSTIYFAFLRPSDNSSGFDTIGAQELQHPYVVVAKEQVVTLLLQSADLLGALTLPEPAEAAASPRLGIRRLSVVRLVSEIVSSAVQLWGEAGEGEAQQQYEAALLEFLRSAVVPNMLTLFLEHPFHSILHHHVCRMLYAVLDSHNAALIEALIKACGLTAWIVGAPIHVPGRIEGFSDSKPGLRAGYCGHLTRLGNRLYTLGVVFEEIRVTLAAECSGWTDWVANYVQVQNDKENVYSWACGRPAMEEDEDSDSDLGDHGLMVGGYTGGAGVEISSRYDAEKGEEEDEEDEEDETDYEVNNDSYYDDSLAVMTSLHHLTVESEDGEEMALSGPKEDPFVDVATEEAALAVNTDAVAFVADFPEDDIVSMGDSTPPKTEATPAPAEEAGEFSSFSYWKSDPAAGLELPDDLK